MRLIPLLILLFFRFYDLGVRPPHHDEAVNGWFVDGMLSRGFYVYDPHNYHGPLFFYILAFFTKVFGRSIEVLRFPIVMMSFLVNFSPFLFRKWIGERAAWIAVYFLAVSPAMVFYSRYTIHELGFTLSCILFFYFWLRTRTESFSRGNIVGLGFSLGAMISLKENFVIFIASLMIAETSLRILEKMNPKMVTEPTPKIFSNPKKSWLGVGMVVGIGFVCMVLIFSALGYDPNGIKNFFLAFDFWSNTGTNGNGHQKPFFYWISILGRLEWFAGIGLLLTPLALRRVPSMVRLLSILGFGLVLAYSIVPYKTPWCLLSFYWGLVFVAAFWISRLMEDKNLRASIAFVLFCGFFGSAYQAYVCAYEQVDAENHPYIYGQTYRDLMKPLQEIVQKGNEKPELREKLKIAVISTFTWPLPYVLGEFKQVGYYGEKNTPEVLNFDYIIMDKSFEGQMKPRLSGKFTRTEVRSRQWAVPVVIFTNTASQINSQ